jgi:hypothetical protein
MRIFPVAHLEPNAADECSAISKRVRQAQPGTVFRAASRASDKFYLVTSLLKSSLDKAGDGSLTDRSETGGGPERPRNEKVEGANAECE